MTTEQEIVKSKHALQSALDNNKIQTCLDILDTLSRIKVTGDLLKKTDIGKTVGKLRTHSNVKLAIKAKDTVKKWKDDVVHTNAKNDHKQQHTSHSSSSSSTSSSEKKARVSTSHSQSSSETSTTKSTPKAPVEGPPRTVKSDEVYIKSTGSVPRNKTIELMYASIGFGSGADSDLLLKRALEIEKTLFSEFGDIDQGYKNKARTLALNLKSKANPGLRESVVSGELSITKLCKMSVEDMQSEEAKARDRKLAEEALFKARGAGSAQAETDMFMCGKCKNRKCTYFQMQTRSADEPMTTFVTCITCGNHWKFC